MNTPGQQPLRRLYIIPFLPYPQLPAQLLLTQQHSSRAYPPSLQFRVPFVCFSDLAVCLFL